MKRSILSIAAWPSLALFLLMAVSGALVAWISFDLIHQGMENYRFLREQGLLAVMEGGLWQALELVVKGCVSLCAYLVFKNCEVELVNRWRTRAS